MTIIQQLQILLRSTDEVKAILDVSLITDSESAQDAQSKRVLAVISHKDDWNLSEEGWYVADTFFSSVVTEVSSLFICKYRANTINPEELEIQRIFPIYGEFSIVISQMRRGANDNVSQPFTTAWTKSVLEQPRAVITLSITPAEGLPSDAHPATFSTHDVQGLKNLVGVCKKLKEVSDVDPDAIINIASSTTHFSWLRPYFTKRTTITSLATTPQDLRQSIRPLIDRLSPACAGLMGDDHSDAQAIRDEWILAKTRSDARRQHGGRELFIRIGTFNVNGKFPSQDLSAWIQGDRISTVSLPPLKAVSPFSLGGDSFDWTTGSVQPSEESIPASLPVDPSDPDPDMFVLGFQELDLSTEALIYSTGTVREDAWCNAVFAALGEKGQKYEKLVSKQLVGMLIVVIVKKVLVPCFGDVKTCASGAGILGIMGNKGGTAVRLTFTPPMSVASKETESIASERTVSVTLGSAHSVPSPGPTTFTFVNAHLAAFDEMVDKRNLDFMDLSRKLSFEADAATIEDGGNNADDPLYSGIDPNSGEGGTGKATFNLNYRVDLPDTQMRNVLKDEEWNGKEKFEALLRFDQLKKSMQDKKAFEGFIEGTIEHMPTYRFSPGLMMDKLGYDLKRKPAWTDRILYMNSSTSRVRQLSYRAHPEIVMSDHRPVSANFVVDMDYYDKNELRSSASDLFDQVHDLDGESSLHKGGLRVDNMYIDFEKIGYDTKVQRMVTVRNTSKYACAFRFVPIQLDAPIHPEWLHIHPMLGVLLPNEATEITLTAHVDNGTAAKLNQKASDLSSTLILHTVLGKDHFISISAEYQYTCFANSLSRLTRLKAPIRSMNSPHDLLPEKNSINAPREVMRLVNWMMTSTPSSDMFLQPGDPILVKNIRECLDTGDEFPYAPDTSDTKVSMAFATTLLLLLDSLSESVVPASLHQRCLEMNDRDEAFELLDALPPASVNVWISVTAFLHFICQILSKNTNYTEDLATIFAPVLLRDDPTSTALSISPNGKRRFLLYFIS
ncbi:Inositol polyphosphate 5-phosphatase OCRL [Psilocybe cubensis]|uniref:Rho-GAP domain-containing protein n=2 Tax=Psilocybe cubensis TaxID=181762 RepID=A0A8H7XTV5_PSICU|nr:Inositol polyphosphate 5-phosphatase OCRL [Psilocybe cubensis]KAH9474443.1 Inositol polyphosphate 5-phosphatase OCRL [Psilocybe cubensis]